MSKLRASSVLTIFIVLSVVNTGHAQPQAGQYSDEVFDLVDQIVSKKDLNNLPDYNDDRSTPEALISSFYNAINRGEFSRAYGYYDGGLPDFASWVRGYENTRTIQLLTGPSEADPGAGTIYWHQPVAIEAESYDGKKDVFGGCFELSQAAPLNQEVPPFHPITISSGSLKRTTKSLEQSIPATCMPD